MATYKVQAPDGRIIELEGPEGATEQEIIAKAQELLTQQEQSQRSLPEEVLRQIGLTGRAAYEGFTAPATATLEALATGYNLAADKLGLEGRIPSIAGSQSQMLTDIGVPQPETRLERAVQAGTQAMVGTAGMAKAFPNMPGMATDLWRQIPAAGAGGLAAQPTAEMVKERTGSDLAAILASIGVGAATSSGAGKSLSALRQGKTKLYTIEEIQNRAERNYTALDNTGITIKPRTIGRIYDDVLMAIDDAGITAGTPAADALNLSLQRFRNIASSNNPINFNTLKEMRAALNNLKQDESANVRRLAGAAVARLDNSLSSLSARDVNTSVGGSLASRDRQVRQALKLMKDARQDWRNQAKASILQDALDVAEARKMNPTASESELIRQGFISIAGNKKKLNLFSENEKGVIRSVAKGSSIDPLLTMAAKFNPQRSQIVGGGLVAGSIYSPEVAIPIGVGGYAADVVQNILRRYLAEKAVKTIASGVAQPQPQDLRPLGAMTGGLFTDIPQ